MTTEVALSTALIAAEPAPASAPVEPVPRAADAATPTPSAEMFASLLALSVTSPPAWTVASPTLTKAPFRTRFFATPTPMASAPVVAAARTDAAKAAAMPKASARTSRLRSAAFSSTSPVAPPVTTLLASMAAEIVVASTFEA